MAKRTPNNCRLVKEHGEPGRDGNRKFLGFAKAEFDDEPIDACKRCKWCVSNQE